MKSLGRSSPSAGGSGASLAGRQRHVARMLPLALLALVGVLLVVLCTGWGAGASPDSVAFIAIARHLLAGEGYRDMYGGPVTVWPPLYPLVLAFLGLFGPDPFVAARWLNAVLFGANIFLVGFILKRCTRSYWIPPLGAFLALVSVDLIEVHAMAWTEPLFFTFMLLAVYFTAAYADAPCLTTLIAAAAATALACFTRYTGLSLLATGVLVIALMTRQQLSAKLKHAALFIAISCLPLAGWMMRNAAVSGGVAGRQIVYHPATLQHVKVGLHTVSLWLLPEHIPATNAQTPFALGLIAVVLVVGALVLMARLAARRARQDAAAGAPSPFARLPLISLIFIALFIVQLLLTISLLDRIIQLTFRYMATIHLLAIVVAMHVVDRFLRPFPHKPGMRLLCAALVALFALFSANRAVWTVNWFHQDGLGLSRTRWRTSKLIERVRHLDAATQVYTNAGDALYLHTNCKVRSVPAKKAFRTGLPNERFDEQIARMRRLLERGEAVVVLFHEHDPGVLPSRAELEALVPLQVRTEVAGEGVILEIAQHEPDEPPSE